MAKSRKQDSSAHRGDERKAAKPARKAAPKTHSGAAGKKAPVRKPPKAAPAAPMIDTRLAAEAAARLVARRDLLEEAAAETPAEKHESASFKQLKESFLKPQAPGPAKFLQSTSPQKKLNLPLGGRNQVGHNQTFGADVNRAGVPRRTGG